MALASSVPSSGWYKSVLVKCGQCGRCRCCIVVWRGMDTGARSAREEEDAAEGVYWNDSMYVLCPASYKWWWRR